MIGRDITLTDCDKGVAFFDIQGSASALTRRFLHKQPGKKLVANPVEAGYDMKRLMFLRLQQLCCTYT